MPHLIVTTREGARRRIEAIEGRSAFEAMGLAGVEGLFGFCGGWGVCATCQVYVDPAFAGRLEPPGATELEMLAESRHRNGLSRLSCQIVMTAALDGLSVTVAPED